jgi:hypothetical protein
MRHIFLLLAVIGLICSWVLTDNQMGERKRGSAYKFCTFLLANKLREVCNGSYYGYGYSKRNAGSIQEQQAQGTAVNTGRKFVAARSLLSVTYFD